MEWYNILVLILGAVGGVGGLVGLYKAKAEKTSIEVENMQSMLEEAHKMFNEMKLEKESVSKEFHDYKEENMKYIGEFKDRFAKVERRLDKTENIVLQLKGAVYQGYRCKYPQNIEDCPVIKEYEKTQCDKCDKCEQV